MSEKRFISEPVLLEQRTATDGTVTENITGYGIVFNQWSLPLTMEMKNGQRVQFIEKILPEAVNGVNFDNAVSMVDHKFTLGKRNKGTMDLNIDERGVKYSVIVPNTTIGNDARENIKNGNLEGSSFQFSLADKGDIWDKTKTPYERTITKFNQISEMGPVTYPAYPDTTAALRSLEETEVEQAREIDYKSIERKLKLYNLGDKRAMVNVNDSTIVALLEDCESMCEMAKYSMMEDSMYKAIDACDLYSDALDLFTCMLGKKSKYLQDVKNVTLQLGQDVLSTLKGNSKYSEMSNKVSQSIELIKSL